MDTSAVDPPRAATCPSTRTVSLVYIAGAHRSGATPLGAVLAGTPTVFYAGELYRIPDPIFDRPDPGRRCSCGAGVDDCPFWSGVRRRLENEPGLLDDLRQGQRRFEAWRWLPWTLVRIRRRDPELLRYVRRRAQLLRMISEAAGARVVVESSYNPVRGLLCLDPVSGVEARFVHLVRDGRSFIHSERGAMDPPEFRWSGTRRLPVIVARWVAYHLLTLLLLPRSGKYLRVRYEEFLANPIPVLEEVSKFSGTELSPSIRSVLEHRPIPMRHILAGNRVRLQGTVLLRPDLAAPPQLSVAARLWFWALGGWLAWGLGYRPRVRADRSSEPATRAA